MYGPNGRRGLGGRRAIARRRGAACHVRDRASFHDSPHPDETNGDAKVQHVRDEAPRTPMVQFGEHHEQEIDGGGHAGRDQQPRKQKHPSPRGIRQTNADKPDRQCEVVNQTQEATGTSCEWPRHPRCRVGETRLRRGFGAPWRSLRCQCLRRLRIPPQTAICPPCRSCLSSSKELMPAASNDRIKTRICMLILFSVYPPVWAR